MHSLFQRVFQSVSRRKRGEIGEHDFFQTNALQHRLKHRRALFQLSAHEKKKPDHHQPPVAHEHPNHHEHDGKNVANTNRALRGMHHINAARENRAQNAPAIHGICRQQIEQTEVEVCPDNAPQQGARVEERSGGQ